MDKEKEIIKESYQTEIISLLQKNNELLQELLKMHKKEQRAQTRRTIFHVIINLLPFIIVMAVVYYLFSLISENIQALQSNIEMLKEFMIGLVPDFSGVGEKLNAVWQDVSFWN